MITEVRNIPLRDGETLQAELVENGSPVWLIVTHGLGEHGGRHKYLYELFSQYYNIITYDLRGHGKSSGRRGWVNKFEDFTDDLGEVIQYLRKEFQMQRYILIGHSMGGLVTASYMQKRVDKDFYPEKVILSAPAVAAAGVFGRLFKLSPMSLTRFLSTFPVTVALGGILDLRKLSHDVLVYQDYVKDPLNVLKIHTQLFFQLIQEAREVFSRPLGISCPLFVVVGTGDVLIGNGEVVNYFSKIEKNASLCVVEGAYHEMHNEVEKYKKPFIQLLKDALLVV